MTVLAFATLPAHQITEASGVFTLVRNFGSSLYISVTVVLLVRSTTANYSRLTEFISPYNKALSFPGLPDLWDPETLTGLTRLAGQVQRQALMIGYINSFYLLALTAAGARPGYTLPPGVQPGLQATHYFSPSQAAYASGVHAIKVAVDVRTGDVKILDYAVAHDCGRVINPGLAQQQIESKLIWALAQATVPTAEWVAGMPRARAMGSLGLPRMQDIPEIVVRIIPSSEPSGGLSGLATTVVAPAVANAVHAGTGRRMRSLPFDLMSGP